MVTADQAEPAEDKTQRLEDKITAMRKEMAIPTGLLISQMSAN